MDGDHDASWVFGVETLEPGIDNSGLQESWSLRQKIRRAANSSHTEEICAYLSLCVGYCQYIIRDLGNQIPNFYFIRRRAMRLSSLAGTSGVDGKTRVKGGRINTTYSNGSDILRDAI